MNIFSFYEKLSYPDKYGILHFYGISFWMKFQESFWKIIQCKNYLKKTFLKNFGNFLSPISISIWFCRENTILNAVRGVVLKGNNTGYYCLLTENIDNALRVVNVSPWNLSRTKWQSWNSKWLKCHKFWIPCVFSRSDTVRKMSYFLILH